MSFLAPWALALAVLVAVPLLVHLRRRQATRRVPFPAIRYLSRAREATARSRRTADLLLLAVRVGLLLSLVLAAAVPLVGRGGPEDHRPTDVALVVDNTASSGRVLGEATLLELHLARAGDVLAAAGPGDRFWVLPAVGGPAATGVPAGAAAGPLGRVPATDGTADLRQMVAAASAALPASPDRAREVVLLGDLQATGFGAGGTGAEATGSATGARAIGSATNGGPARRGEAAPRLLVHRPPDPEAENAAVASVALESGSVWPAGLPQTLVAEVARFPPGEGETSVRLEVDGTTAGGAALPWGGSVVLRLPDLPPGPHRGRVEIEADGLRADDVRHFAFRVVPPPSVRHLGPPDGFLALALETLRAAGRVGDGPDRVRVVEGGGAAASSGGRPGGAGGAEPVAPEGSGEPPSPGGLAATILVPPTDPVELPPFNQILEREGLPWRLRPDSLAGELALADGAGVPGLAGVRILRRYLPTGRTDGAIVLATEDGRPWLLRHGAGSRRHLLLLSPLVPEATSLPTSPAMIPFVEALLLRWSRPEEPSGGDGAAAGGGESVAGATAAGVPVSLPSRVDSVRLPDGTTRRVEGGAPFTPLRAGIYELFGAEASPGSPGPGTGYLAANVAPAESDPRPLDPRRLQELFPGREVDIAGPDPAEWRSALFRERRGVAATPWLLALALVLAAVEASLAAPGREPGPAGNVSAPPRRHSTLFRRA